MATIIFIYDRVKTPIKCKEEDSLRDICNQFAFIDIKSLSFIYGGKEINLDSTFKEQANIFDKNRKEMIILVEDKKKIKNKEIICPKCKEDCRLNIKDYKINLYECKNNHETNNILLNEYNNLYDLNTKINNRNIICETHKDKFISYCSECKLDLCNLCERNHKSHNIINYRNISPNLNEIKENMDIFKIKVDKFNTKIKNIIKILYKVLENIDIYYNFNMYIMENYNELNRNYYMLQNMNDIKSNINTKDIDEIINENNIKIQFQKILDLYEKMNQKNDSNNLRSQKKYEKNNDFNKI